MERRAKNLTSRDIAYIALAIALNVVCAFICVPATIPFTLQTFGIFFTLEFLGGAKGAIAVWLYILLGLIGVPVFSSFGSGIGAIMSATGGFILSFAVVALLYLLPFWNKKPWLIWVLRLLSVLVIYAFGSLWFYFIVGGKGYGAVLLITVVPYLLPDLAKLILAISLAKAVKRALSRKN